MKKFFTLSSVLVFNSFKNNQKGVTAIEYGLIACSVTAMVVIALYGSDGLVLAIQSRLAQLVSLVQGAIVALK